MSLLQLRLKNCIQTILDLEPGLRQRRADIFDSDFIRLKNYLECVEKLNLAEEDVRRLEDVTSVFLTELGRGANWSSTCGLLQ